ncbi:hypothetical protein C2E23DRAFT_340563 [Lenzites betulinus]|nr:hypothetical protein C2E23DRAFT_340563 [Lenzites betulinus]
MPMPLPRCCPSPWELTAASAPATPLPLQIGRSAHAGQRPPSAAASWPSASASRPSQWRRRQQRAHKFCSERVMAAEKKGSVHGQHRSHRAKHRQKRVLTTSQNRNPRSTSSCGYFTPGNVSSQISSAICFASRTPSAFGSRTRCRPFRCVSASRYTFASTPNPVFTSVWNGSDRLMSSRSSRVRRASCRRSMFSDVTSSSVRRARVSDRTKLLNTSSSRDSGADHG